MTMVYKSIKEFGKLGGQINGVKLFKLRNHMKPQEGREGREKSTQDWQDCRKSLGEMVSKFIVQNQNFQVFDISH